MKLIAGLLLVLSAAAQDPPVPKPGKEHELLKQFEGTWTFTSKFTPPEAGAEAMTGKGTETVRAIAHGLFIIFDVEGDTPGGMKFVGHGTMGFDVHRKKYTGSWIDSMGTATYFVEATCDEKGRNWTETMEGPDPRTGQNMKMRLTHEIKDKDTRVAAFFIPGPDGKEIQFGTIEYKRRK